MLTIYNLQDRDGNKGRVWWETISRTYNTLFYVYEIPNGTSQGLMEAQKLALETKSEIRYKNS